MTTEISFDTKRRLSIELPDSMFGANILFDRDEFGGGTFDEAINYLNVSGLRYPGGAVSEKYFDIENPDASSVIDPSTGNTVSLMPLSELISNSKRLGVTPTIVIPTKDLLHDGELGLRDVDLAALDNVRTFVRDVLDGAYGDSEIQGFEIGNEYWGSGQMTAVEYGKIVNLVAPLLDEEINYHGSGFASWAAGAPPKIVIQVGQYGAFSATPGHTQNHEIMNALSSDAASAIDVVTMHFYSSVPSAAMGTYGWFFDRLNSWPAHPKFEHVETWVTEWNTSLDTSDETGLKQSGAMLAMFVEMLRGGVTGSFVWPVQQNTHNDLFGDEGELKATFGGELFKMLSSLGDETKLEFVNTSDSAKSYVFSSQGQTTVFVENFSDKLFQSDVNLSFLGQVSNFVWSQTLGSAGNPDDPQAGVRVKLEQQDVSLPKKHFVSLDPSEVVKIVFVHEGFGTKIEGQEFMSSNQVDSLDDSLLGSLRDDTLLGHLGNDELRGRDGQDMLFGGSGNDTLTGDSGQDLLASGPGDDVLKGGDGADILISTSRILREKDTLDAIEQLVGVGDTGANAYLSFDRKDYPGICLAKGKTAAFQNQSGLPQQTLQSHSSVYGDDGSDLILLDDISADVHGGDGDDRIQLGTGDDEVFGGAGEDVFIFGQGLDSITGGPDSDVFIFETDLSNSTTKILDFDASEDRFIIVDNSTLEAEEISLEVSPSESLGQEFFWTGSDLFYDDPNGGTVIFIDLLG